MKPEIQRRIAPRRLMALTLALILSPGAMAENYVNWGKKYGLAIPDDWRRIERSNVDVFLRAHDKDPKSMDYDAFFCPVDAKPFYSQAYVFVSAELMENSVSYADSIHVGMSREFDRLVGELDDAGPISRLSSRKPVYNRATQTITQVSNINAQGQDQILMIVIKFYQSGIATLYFYTTEEKFERFEEKFKEIADSFTDANLEKLAGDSKPKIVDVSGARVEADKREATQTAGDDSDRSSGKFPWVIATALGLVILVVILRRRRRAT